MDCVSLLKRAGKAGLKVTTDGEKLSVTGPRRLESLAKEILSHKKAVIDQLTREERKPDLTQLTTDKTDITDKTSPHGVTPDGLVRPDVPANVAAAGNVPLALARNAVELMGGKLLDIDRSRLDLDEPHSLEANRKRIHQCPQPTGRT